MLFKKGAAQPQILDHLHQQHAQFHLNCGPATPPLSLLATCLSLSLIHTRYVVHMAPVSPTYVSHAQAKGQSEQLRVPVELRQWAIN